MKYLQKLPALILVIFTLLVSCKEDDPVPAAPLEYDTADLITRNFLTADAAFDWIINENVVAEGVEYSYGNKTEFEWIVDSTTIDFSVNAAGTSNELFSTPLLVEKDKSYFSALLGSASTGGLVLLDENDETLPAAENVRIRFLHAYQTSGPVDLYIGGTDPEHKLVDGMEYATMSAYIEVSEVDLNESIICTEKGVVPDPTTNLFTITNSIVHEKGKIYIDILGSATFEPGARLSLFVTDQ